MRAALIPMKELAQAKMRLGDVLDADARAALTLAMLADVIAVCRESACFDEIAVVTRDREVCWQARELGAKPIVEPATLGGGLNEGVTFAQRYLARRVAVSELVILPADVPLARAADARAVVEALAADDGPRVVLVRSRDNGTNALALRPPEVIAVRFGPDSADAHAAAARAAGVEPVELPLDHLAFDVDAPEDFDALRALPVGPATRRFLDQHPLPTPSASAARPSLPLRDVERGQDEVSPQARG